MNFLELAKKRYSVRNFTPQKVLPEDLKLILEAGRIAPTGKNLQPQRLLVLTSDETLAKAKKAARTYDAPLIILVCSDSSVAWRRPYDGKKLTDIDASIVTDHMMLQATELGLGTVWICWFDPEILRQEFSLPDHFEPIALLAIGYADTKAREASSPNRHEKLRKPLSETVSYEHL